MSRYDRGFTLVELMIVVAVIAILALIAIPNQLAAGGVSRETAAISTLKNLAASQGQIQARAIIDLNNNGVGEYGFFKELAGGGLRTLSGAVSAINVSPPVMSRSFGELDGSGTVIRSGYHFRLFLPSGTGAGVAESQAGYNGAVDTARAETTWCCYAWPVGYGSTGVRAFFVNSSGDVLFTRNNLNRFSGSAQVPGWDAAFLAGVSSMNGTTAMGGTGNSGDMWVLVN